MKRKSSRPARNRYSASKAGTPENFTEECRSREVPDTALPAAFLAKMQELLGEEYEAFLKSYEEPRTQGLRLNPLKRADARTLCAGFGLRKIPWAREGYYYDASARPGSHPYHDAGLYYIQEPSAMMVAELLDPRPGERVLDLCAAPGGKTTQIAGRMAGEGLLVSNEINPSRARILSQNVERFGAANVFVTNEDPLRLSRHFPAFFDRILVDAPCSGEGMFRKDETAIREWSPENVRICAARQREILENALCMLKAGGRLVYSTCTFSPEENEKNIKYLLDSHEELSVEEAELREGMEPGRPEWSGGECGEIGKTVRIWPHRTEGEGHYAAVLRKGGIPEEKREKQRNEKIGEDIYWLWIRFCGETLSEPLPELFGDDARRRMILYGQQLYLLPEGIADISGIKTLRPGLHLGTVKDGLFKPSHALAMYLHPHQVMRSFNMEADGEAIRQYLRGEAVSADGSGDGCQDAGWTLMCVDGCSAGWAKKVGQILKNHYPKGLRRQTFQGMSIFRQE